MSNGKRSIYTYLAVTLVLSIPFYAVIIHARRMGVGHRLVVAALMWCPGVAAVLCCVMLRRSLRTLGWRWPGMKNLGIAYMLPVFYAGVAYGGVWLARLGGLNSALLRAAEQPFPRLPAWAAVAIYVGITATAGVLLNTAFALGEEIGWRGFLVPELAKAMSYTRVSVISGLIWGLWHAPVLLFADYNAGTNRVYALACFMLMTNAASFLFTWLRLKSGSLWPAALLHGAHNAFVQGVFDQFMRDTGHTRWITTEFGAGMILTIGALALYFWSRRGELQIANPHFATPATA
jgi:CAAX protease family protein